MKGGTCRERTRLRQNSRRPRSWQADTDFKTTKGYIDPDGETFRAAAEILEQRLFGGSDLGQGSESLPERGDARRVRRFDAEVVA